MSDEQERKRFEAHMRTEFPTASEELLLGRSKTGSYGSMVSEHAWRSWQAAIRSMIDRGSAGGALQGAKA